MSVRQAVLELYREVDADVAAAGPVCVASGRCCRFKEYGHTLFLSHLEADVLLAAAPAYDPAGVTPDFCPFQKGNLCTAREPRPLGCRVYYCDPAYQGAMTEITEKYLGRLKQLADDHDAGWRYAPLHVFLREKETPRMTRLLPLLCLLLVAADWPQWLGPKRDGVSTETVKPWKGGLKVLWTQPVGPGHSSPVIAGGKVYLHARVKGKEAEALSAFDAKTGKPLWSTSYERPKFWTLFGTGPQATPAVSGGKVFTFGPTGMLTAFDAEKGDKLWQVDTEKDFNVKRLGFGAACSPLVDGKNVVVNVGGKEGASVVAFTADKGEVAWKSLNDPASYASGVRVGDQLVFLTQQGLRGLNPEDGKKVWDYKLVDKLDESSTTPVVSGDVLLAASITQGMVGLRRKSDGVSEVWKNKELTCYFSTPVPVGAKHVYVVTGKLGLGVSSTLHCVELQTGKALWSKEKVGTYHAAMLRTADDKLLMLSDFGDLMLLEPDPKEYRELARTKVTKNGGIWAHPALSDGRVYLRDDKELICIQMPE